MTKRVKVTDPYSGVTIEVNEGSPQARAWGKLSTPKQGQEPKQETKPSTRSSRSKSE